MSDKWSSEQLFSKAEELNQIALLLEPYLVSVIEELSGERISEREAARLAGFWLLHFVHRVFGVIADADDNSEIWNISESDSQRTQVPHDRRKEMASNLADRDFRSMVDRLIIHVWRFRSLPKNLIIEKKVDNQDTSRSAKFIKLGLETVTQPLFKDTRIWIAHPYLKVSPVHLLSSQLKSRTWARWLPTNLSLKASGVEIAAAKRRAMAQREEVSGFDSLLRVLLPLMIPFGYAEELGHYRKQVVRQFINPPQLLHSSIGLQVDHWYQVAASVWGEMGTVISSHQHGGHSGLDARHVLEELEIRTSDRYYTFGWTTGSSRVKPLPIPMPQRAKRREESRVLLMSLESSDYVYRLQPFAMPSHSQLCFKETQAFVKALHNKASLIVRCREQDRQLLGLNEFNIGWETLRGAGSISASRSRLVVHNYFGTSWLETLSMNVPTLCFVPAGIHQFRADAQLLVDALVQVGVIHQSGKEAARFLNSLGHNIEMWWRSSDVQAARTTFVSHYANFSDDWLDAWRDEFESQIAT